MRVFWENGYAGTSVGDLAAALGVNKPSLYAAFGNKQRLFETALERYRTQYGAPLRGRLDEPADAPLATRIRAYMRGIVDLVSDRSSPQGCLLVKSSCEAGSGAMPGELSASLQDIGLAAERDLTEFLETERRNGQLPRQADAGELAGYLLSVLYGLSVLARRGKPQQELYRIVDTAIDALPGRPDVPTHRHRSGD